LFKKKNVHDFVKNCLFGVDINMENQKEYFCHITLLLSKRKKNAVLVHKKLCDVYGEDALKLR